MAWFGRSATTGEEEEWETGAGTDPVWDARIAAAAVLSFRGGMETLVHALVKALRGFRNVTLRSDTAVRTISELNDDENSIFEVCLFAPRTVPNTNTSYRRSTSQIQIRRSKQHISSLRSRSPSSTPSSRSPIIHSRTSSQTPILQSRS